MRQNKFCDTACTYSITEVDISLYKWFIDNFYESHWTLDGLPSGLNSTGIYSDIDVGQYVNKSKVIYSTGIPIGKKIYQYEEDTYKYYIYNHFTFNVKINQEKLADNFTIVGFDIIPISLGLRNDDNTTYCYNEPNYILNFIRGKQQLDIPQTIHFTYDIIFEVCLIK